MTADRWSDLARRCFEAARRRPYPPPDVEVVIDVDFSGFVEACNRAAEVTSDLWSAYLRSGSIEATTRDVPLQLGP